MLTTKQAADRRGVRQATILQMIRQRRIPFEESKWGERKVYLISEKDVDEAMIKLPHSVLENEINPSGLCMCGCGEKTKKYVKTASRTGAYKGCYAKFIQGHNDLALSKELYRVDAETGCWNWCRHIGKDGYVMHKGIRAHRFFYEKHKGKIPDGLEIDHLCRNRKCVNPDHLEAVTARENTRRSSVCKTTLKMANEIREIYAGGGITQKELAIKYNVSECHVGRIVRNEYWTD